MSKKIALFLVIVGIFTCLLSVSISAQVITFDSYEEKTNLTYDKSELVTFDDECSYPAYYIFDDSEDFITNYEWLNNKTGKNYGDANVVELCIPTGVKTGGYFKKDSSFKKLTKLNTGKTLTKTNGDFYQNQTLVHVTFGGGYTNGGLGTWFFNGAKVEYIIFDDSSSVTTLPNAFLANLATLKGLYLGQSITNIGSGTFANMGSSNVFLMNTPNDTTAPEVYYFKSTLVEGNFYNFKTNSTTTAWVFPSTVNGIGTGWNIDNSSNIPKNFVFLTANADDVVINDAIGSSKFNTTKLYFPNISSENKALMSVTPKTTYYFGLDAKKASYNGSWGELSDMVYSDHQRDTSRDIVVDATCETDKVTTTYCFCGDLLGTVREENSAFGHDYSVYLGLIYESFLKKGHHKYQCTKCDGINGIEEPALFICLGYSAPMYGNGGIAIGYAINHDAVDNYEKVTGKSVSFGLFAVAKERLEDNEIFDENGNMADGAISTDLTRFDIALFELKVVGFTDEYKDVKLAMGAFVKETENGVTKYSYLQAGTPLENEKYEFVSFNDIVK